MQICRYNINLFLKLMLAFCILIYITFVIILVSLKHVSSLDNLYKHEIYIYVYIYTFLSLSLRLSSSLSLLSFYYAWDAPLQRCFSKDHIASSNQKTVFDVNHMYICIYICVHYLYIIWTVLFQCILFSPLVRVKGNSHVSL